MEDKLKRTQIYISESKLKQLKYIALEQDTNVSEIIRKLIDEYLEKEKKK
jgi:hypothetical protein